jgi:hypothetical protein
MRNKKEVEQKAISVIYNLAVFSSLFKSELSQATTSISHFR